MPRAALIPGSPQWWFRSSAADKRRFGYVWSRRYGWRLRPHRRVVHHCRHCARQHDSRQRAIDCPCGYNDIEVLFEE